MADDKLKAVKDELFGVVQLNDMKLEMMNPRKIAENDLNWKQHPSLQRDAYADLWDEVGWAGALLLNRRAGRLLDGHMRLQDSLERNLDVIPVLTIDVDEQKENKILALLDKIGTMYQERKTAVSKLATIAETRSALLASIMQGNADAENKSDAPNTPKIAGRLDNTLPEGGVSLVLGQSFNYIALVFRTEMDWIAAQDHFDLKKVKCAFNSGVGLGRVIDGGAYLKKMLDQKHGIDLSSIQAMRQEALSKASGESHD